MIVDKLLYEIGIDTKGVQEGLTSLQSVATQVDNEFNGMASKWGGVIQGLLSSVIAPVAGAFAIGKVINSYMSDVSEVASITGAYNQKLDEWRVKRAQLARVTKEDIELYKQYKEAMTGFNIAIADVSAKLMRSFSPVMKKAVSGLQDFTKWINRNQDNITRFLLVLSGVLTTVFLPAIIKTSAALLMSPLTWLIGALGVLVLIFDDLTTYIRGGKSAFGDFWAIFGTGPEIMQKLTKAFENLKQLITIIGKPLAVVLGLFAGFKIAMVLIGMFVKSLYAVKAAMTLIALHPIMAMLVALVGLIMWVSNAFNRAGGDWQKTFELMGQDIIDFLNIFGGLGDWILGALEPVKGLLTSLGGIITGVLSAIANIGKLFWSYLTGGSEEAKAQIVEDIKGSIVHAFESLISYAKNLWPAFLNVMSGLGKMLSALGDLALKGLLATFQFVFDMIIGGFKFVLDSILGIFGGLGAGIGKIFDSIASAISSIISNIITTITSFFSGLISSIANIASNIISIYISIFDAIVSFASDIYSFIKSYFESVANIAITIISTVINAYAKLWQWIQDAISAYLKYLSNAFLVLKNFALSLWQGIQKAALNAIEAIGNIFSTIWDSIKSFFDLYIATIKSILGYMAKPFIFLKGIIGNIGNIASKAFDAIKSAANTAISWIIKIWSDIPNTIRQMIPIEALSEKLNQVKEYFGSLTDMFASLKDKVLQVFDNIANIITSAFDSGLQAAMDFFNAILSFFTQIPSKIAAAFDISGLIDGAKNKLKDMAGGAMDGFKSFLGFGDSKEEQAKTTQNANQALQNTVQTINSGIATNNQALAQTPITANTSSITNSTYNNDNSRRANSNQVNNTVNINVANNTDARGIVREAQKSFNNLNASNNYVTASEYGNFNT